LDGTLVLIMARYFKNIADTLSVNTGFKEYHIYPSYLKTKVPCNQGVHLDDEVALTRALKDIMYILHIPLTDQGRAMVRVLHDPEKRERERMIHNSYSLWKGHSTAR
jgi:hypothetical protein